MNSSTSDIEHEDTFDSVEGEARIMKVMNVFYEKAENARKNREMSFIFASTTTARSNFDFNAHNRRPQTYDNKIKHCVLLPKKQSFSENRVVDEDEEDEEVKDEEMKGEEMKGEEDELDDLESNKVAEEGEDIVLEEDEDNVKEMEISSHEVEEEANQEIVNEPEILCSFPDPGFVSMNLLTNSPIGLEIDPEGQEMYLIFGTEKNKITLNKNMGKAMRNYLVIIGKVKKRSDEDVDLVLGHKLEYYDPADTGDLCRSMKLGTKEIRKLRACQKKHVGILFFRLAWRGK